MQVSEYGEKQFIQSVLAPFASTAAADRFDDAIVLDLNELAGTTGAGYLVYSMDQPSFIPHADTQLDPFRFYGRWVAGTTCNDVIAMGARCRGFSLALSIPPDARVADLQSLMLGITDVLERCGASYEGGNIDSGPLATVGCAWGIAPRHALVRRSGAQPGDVIAVTGQPGLPTASSYRIGRSFFATRRCPSVRLMPSLSPPTGVT
jgi:thiamine monophosphate kinase